MLWQKKNRRSLVQSRRRSCWPLLVAPLVLTASVFFLWQDSRIHIRLEGRLLEQIAQDHKSLIPLTTRDGWSFVLAGVGLIMSAGGGIGGGGILVPIYILVLKFPAKYAIPLSNVSVFGGAIANTFLNVPKRHPLADRPLIDWDLILVMEPLTILGALIGTNLNKLLPETVIVVLLVVLLSFTAYKTLNKAMKMYEKETMGWTKVETEDDDNAVIELELTTMENGGILIPPPPSRLNRRSSSENIGQKQNIRKARPVLSRSVSSPQCGSFGGLKAPGLAVGADLDIGLHSNKKQRVPGHLLRKTPTRFVVSARTDDSSATSSETSGSDSADSLFQHILDEERRTPKANVCIIVSLFFTVLLANILKGGGAFESPIGIQCGSLSFWMAEAAIALCVLVVSWIARSHLLKRARLKRQADYVYLEGDIEWNESSTLLYPTICCLAGFFAGMFGIGGGIVKAPLMVALGVHPAVASATSACMILFTSFTATTSFLVFGLLVKDYAVVCFVLGFVATLVGQTIMTRIVQRYQRNSYIAFCIGGVVLLSAICMTLESAISILSGGGGSRESTGLCSSTHL